MSKHHNTLALRRESIRILTPAELHAAHGGHRTKTTGNGTGSGTGNCTANPPTRTRSNG